MIKENSRWSGINNKEFKVLFVGVNGDNEENTIFYEDVHSKKTYSCWEGSFLSRFTEIKNVQ